jgi:hypothetical protein
VAKEQNGFSHDLNNNRLELNVSVETPVVTDNLKLILALQCRREHKCVRRNNSGVLHLILSVHNAECAAHAGIEERQRIATEINLRNLDGRLMRS